MVFETPQPIDTTATTARETPASWKKYLGADERESVQVLSLVASGRGGRAGWCTAGFELEGPEIEVMCGGINTKQPTHAGLWRQGNLVHFGFQQDPSEFNETGRKLLVNSVVYASRFTEDRPVTLGRSPLDQEAFVRLRHYLKSSLDAEPTDVAAIAEHFGAPWSEQIEALSGPDAIEWVRAHWSYIHSANRKLALDADAVALGVPRDTDELFERAPALLEHSESSGRMRVLLARLFPEGPGAEAESDAWSAWLTEVRPYAFFNDTDGYVWKIDVLARARGVPTKALRGTARADDRTTRGAADASGR